MQTLFIIPSAPLRGAQSINNYAQIAFRGERGIEFTNQIAHLLPEETKILYFKISCYMDYNTIDINNPDGIVSIADIKKELQEQLMRVI